MKPFDLEKVYDEKIAPLMTQIIAICKEAGMPMFATFCYKYNEDDSSDFCTTAITKDNWLPEMIERIRREATRPLFQAFTITTIPKGDS